MNNVYIDCGANLGQGYEKLLANKHIPIDVKVYMFEPLKNGYNYLIKKYPTATVYNSAVWVENTTLNLNIETANISNINDVGHASNVLGESYNIKKSSNLGWKTEKIEAIDLNEFIIKNFHIEDNIIIKFNIEGAEYEIMDHLIKNGGYKYIKKAKIDFHRHLRNDSQKLKPDDYYVTFFKSNGVILI